MTRYVRYCNKTRCVLETSASPLTAKPSSTVEAIPDGQLADREGAWGDAVQDLYTVDWSTVALSDHKRLVVMGRKDLMSDSHWTSLISDYPQS